MFTAFDRLQRRLRYRRWVGLGLIVLVVAGGVTGAVCWLSGCQSTQPTPIVTRGQRVAGIDREPLVRVRIGRGVGQVTLSSASGLRIGPLGAPAAQQRTVSGVVRVSRDAQQGFIIEPAGAAALQWKVPALWVTAAAPGSSVNVDGRPYPYGMAVHAAGGGDAAGPAPIDVINHVPMEQYLPGVLNRELYSHWEPEAYRVQAIAARSYAIYSLPRTRKRHYDLESTQASQAYSGQTTNPKALAAVRDTRGIVLTYQGGVLQAYYSSCCGGVGQDAAAIFPNQRDIDPLRGMQHGSWCKASSYYRWSVTRSRRQFSNRLAAWGSVNNHPIGGLGVVKQVRVGSTNPVGRPTRFVVVDENGAKFELSAEQFRFACNHAADDAQFGKLASRDLVRSSHAVVTVSDRQVLIRGAGFGHGVGMCQFGAQAMAKAGYKAPGILMFYYPNAELRKAYQ